MGFWQNVKNEVNQNWPLATSFGLMLATTAHNWVAASSTLNSLRNVVLGVCSLLAIEGLKSGLAKLRKLLPESFVKQHDFGVEDAALTEMFAPMRTKMDLKNPVKVNLQKTAVANAKALIGGDLVVLNSGAKENLSYDEVEAVMAHEFTHLNGGEDCVESKKMVMLFQHIVFGNMLVIASGVSGNNSKSMLASLTLGILVKSIAEVQKKLDIKPAEIFAGSVLVANAIHSFNSSAPPTLKNVVMQAVCLASSFLFPTILDYKEEYRADLGSAEYMGTGKYMASALEKMEAHNQTLPRSQLSVPFLNALRLSEKTAASINNSFDSAVGNIWRKIQHYRTFYNDTHPSDANRIKRMEQYDKEMV